MDDSDFVDLGKFDFRENVLDLHVVAFARCVILPLLYCQAASLGTMYRYGRDGHSLCQVAKFCISLSLSLSLSRSPLICPPLSFFFFCLCRHCWCGC